MMQLYKELIKELEEARALIAQQHQLQKVLLLILFLWKYGKWTKLANTIELRIF
jgi:hypothetical protein